MYTIPGLLLCVQLCDSSGGLATPALPYLSGVTEGNEPVYGISLPQKDRKHTADLFKELLLCLKELLESEDIHFKCAIPPKSGEVAW